MQFYCLLPFFLKYRKTIVNVAAISLIVISISSRYFLSTALPYPAVWNFSTSHLDAFAIGILIAVNTDALQKLSRYEFAIKILILLNFLVLEVLCVLSFETVYTSQYSSFTYFLAAFTFGLCVLIATFSQWHFKGDLLISWLGKRSYGVYVVHFPIVFFVLAKSENKYLSVQSLIFVITASLIVSEISFRFLEKPFLKLGRRF